MPDNEVNNIAQVNIIEGLMSQIHSHLQAIQPQNTEQRERVFDAIENFKCWQENELYELRRIFE